MPGQHPDRRRFSDEDIEAIVTAINERRNLEIGEIVAALQLHQENHATTCRFRNLTTEQVQNAILFHGHIEALLTETGSTVRKTVIAVGVTGLISLLVLGLYAKIKQVMGAQ